MEAVAGVAAAAAAALVMEVEVAAGVVTEAAVGMKKPAADVATAAATSRVSRNLYSRCQSRMQRTRSLGRRRRIQYRCCNCKIHSSRQAEAVDVVALGGKSKPVLSQLCRSEASSRLP